MAADAARVDAGGHTRNVTEIGRGKHVTTLSDKAADGVVAYDGGEVHTGGKGVGTPDNGGDTACDIIALDVATHHIAAFESAAVENCADAAGVFGGRQSAQVDSQVRDTTGEAAEEAGNRTSLGGLEVGDSMIIT